MPASKALCSGHTETRQGLEEEDEDEDEEDEEDKEDVGDEDEEEDEDNEDEDNEDEDGPVEKDQEKRTSLSPAYPSPCVER